MENEVDLAPAGPDLSSTPNLGPGSSPLYPGLGQGVLGSNRTMYPGQSANPLDDAERILKAKRDRMQIGLTGPMSGVLQFLAPDEVKKLGEEAAQTDLQIQGVQEKRQQQQTNQALARNMGLTRGMSPTAGPGDIIEEALSEWRKGNYDAYRGLHGAGQGARADLYMDEGVNALGKQTEAAQKAVGQLNSATNQFEYNSIRSQVLKHPEFSSLGMNENNLPKYQTEWKEKRGSVTAKLNQAQQVVETFNQKQASLSQAVPVTDEKVAGAVTKGFAGRNGDAFPNTQAVTLPGAGGATGVEFTQPGSKDMSNYGPNGTWNNGSTPELETQAKQLNGEQFKGVLGKYKTAKDFYTVAMDDNNYKYSAGLAAINDKFGGVERNVAEGSRGAGTIGLTKQLELQYGVPEHLANAVAKFRSELKSWADNGKTGPLPKMSPQSIEGMKYVAAATYNQDKKELDRLASPAYSAGWRGIGLEKLGLDKEIQNDPYLKGLNEKGTEDYRLDVDKYPFIVKGDKRIALREDAQVPGMIPAGSYAKGLPKAGERGTGEMPAKVPGSPPAAPVATGLSSPGDGGGAPASGISKDYLIKTAKVESGNEPNPWNAGNSKTSASGAFQFTNATWNQYKPPDAPNRAADATPQQQTEAANNLTNANAKILARNNVPVNDTTAYIAHNLGATGAVKFMNARDDAKARAVVGEEAANNNPLFFKGDPTVAEAKARYAKVMGQPEGAAFTAKQAEENYYTAASQVPKKLANIAPAIGATGGMLVGGPSGALLGGAAGGAVRQAALGGPGYVDQMARGALEAIPAAIPGIGPARIAARVVAGGAVPAAEKLYDSGGEDTGGAIESGAAGAVGGILGEGAGIFGHALWSKFGPGPQKELIAAAKVLATQEPKVADATGKMVVNPAYAKAKQDIEAIGKNPDQVAHVARAAMAGVPKGETLAKRPAEVERVAAGRELNDVQKEVGAAGGNVPVAPHASLPNGPASTIKTPQNPNGTVPDTKFWRDTTQYYEINATAPAKNVDAKWERIGQDRTELLKKERDAMASDHPNKDEFVKGFRAIADSLGEQQKAMARALLPPDKAAIAIGKLDAARERYARAMAAGAGEKGDIVKAIAQGGAEGRKAQAAFDALAGNDPAARRMVRSLVEMEKSKLERLGVGAAIIGGAQLLHMVPVVGSATATAITAVKAGQMIRDYMAKKGAGAPVTFKTILDRELGHARRAGSVIGSSVGNQMAQ